MKGLVKKKNGAQYILMVSQFNDKMLSHFWIDTTKIKIEDGSSFLLLWAVDKFSQHKLIVAIESIREPWIA